MIFGSLFAGAGGFDLGFERAGMRCAWQVEINKHCQELLERHWPNIPKWRDVKDEANPYTPVDLVCGGDPCPKHSFARMGQQSRHPDLSGYFLALAGRLYPRWLVRENVPSPSVDVFATALEAIGYGVVVVRIDAASFVPQNRARDFVIGCREAGREGLRALFRDCESGSGNSYTKMAKGMRHPCMVAKAMRDNDSVLYIWEDGRIRVPDCEEREALAGFPTGWTSGFSRTARAKMTGNAVCPHVAEWIGRRIMQYGAQK